jgi:hypothetical protein
VDSEAFVTPSDFLDIAKMVAVLTGWALIVGAAWGLLVFAGSFAVWFWQKCKKKARK